jgi:hypothetical protein
MINNLPPTIEDAIFSLVPDGAFMLENSEDLSTLEWLIPKTKKPEETGTPFVGVVNQDADRWWDDLPTQKQIIAEFDRLTIQFEQKQYARNRTFEYPAIGDQLDALFHAGVFPEEMAAQIQAIKDKYPKPEELNG